MGIIEFHLDKPEFEFSPSMNTGRKKDREGSSLLGDSDDDHDSDLDSEWSSDETESSGGRGKFVALAVLVGLGLLMGWRRRRSGSMESDELDTQDEVEVYN